MPIYMHMYTIMLLNAIVCFPSSEKENNVRNNATYMSCFVVLNLSGSYFHCRVVSPQALAVFFVLHHCLDEEEEY